MNLNIRVDDRAVQSLLKSLPKQAAYASSVALTKTAQDARDEVVASLPQKFTMRTKWVANGIRIKPSDKKRLVASVWSKDKFMARQEYGRHKTPGSAASVAIPHGARARKTSVTRPSRYPRALLAKGNHFIAKSKRGHALYRRGGRGGRKLKLMYGFAPSVKVKARFGMTNTVRATTYRRFKPNFEYAIRKTINTMR